jgi:predicted PurR-regulated permease PerM
MPASDAMSTETDAQEGSAVKQVNWTRILTILLVILASIAILYVLGTVLHRFTHVLLIFLLGAIVAYVLTPIVNSLAVVVRARWLAIILTYLLLAFVLFGIAVLLFTPFVQQSQSLVDNLHTPSSGSLNTTRILVRDAKRVQSDLVQQQGLTIAGVSPSTASIDATGADIAALQTAVTSLSNGTLSGPIRRNEKPGIAPNGRQPPNPPPQTKIPPSYVKPISQAVQRLSRDYGTALQNPAQVRSPSFARAIADANAAVVQANQLNAQVSGSPILLLRSQLWLDQHGIAVNLHEKFGDAAKQLSDRSAVLLDNAVTIISEAANLLLNTVLILIVSFYFLSDGRRIIHAGVGFVPEKYEEQVWFFMLQLDKVLGGYIRGQLFISALAGILAVAGAAALGVPYPLLIGIITFLLESIPVVGPMVAFVPPVIIALFFTSVLTTVILFIWFMVYQQIVTNFLGPKIMGTAVGIHPLEAIAAVLIGYPIGGFIGAFLAVPIAGILHILIRELYAYFAHGKALPTAPVTVPGTMAGAESQRETGAASGAEGRRAAG